MENNLSHKGKKVGVGRKLTSEQEAKIFRLMSTRRPFQSGFNQPYKNVKLFFWTRDLLRKRIQDKFDVKLTDGGIVNYLTRWGFPPLDRSKSKAEQCHKVIRSWLDLNQNAMMDRSRVECAHVYWVGDIGLVGLKSPETGRQKRLSMVSVISNQGRVNWLVVRGKFTPERQVMLLNSLIGQANQKVFLIRRTNLHFNNQLVSDWLKQNFHKLEIFPPLLSS